MQTGQSIRACLRRGVPADHEAHSRSGDSCEESQRLSFGGLQPGGRSRGKPDHGNEPRSPHTQMLRADSCRAATWDDLRHKARRGGRTTVDDSGKQSRARPDERPDERCSSPFAIQTFEAQAPTTRCSQRRTRVAADTAWRSSRAA